MKRGDVGFVATIIYSAIVILGIVAIIMAFTSIFTPKSSFSNDAQSFTRWIETGGNDPYAITIKKDEGFVLGYQSNCSKYFQNLQAACSPDRLCLCLAGKDNQDGPLSRTQCIEVPQAYIVSGEKGVNSVSPTTANQAGGCASSYAPVWLIHPNRQKAGIYTFTLKDDTITVALEAS